MYSSNSDSPRGHHRAGHGLQGEEHAVEEECGGEQEQEDGEHDGTNQQLVHGAVGAVHATTQRVVLFTNEQPPQSNYALKLAVAEAASIGVETLNVDSETCKQVTG